MLPYVTLRVMKTTLRLIHLAADTYIVEKNLWFQVLKHFSDIFLVSAPQFLISHLGLLFILSLFSHKVIGAEF